MSFEEVIGNVTRWLVALEALGALGAELSLQQSGVDAPPEVTSALRAVSVAAGLGDLEDLAPPQRQMIVGLVRQNLHQTLDLVESPARAPGWTFTDPVILDGWGRGSMMVPPQIANAHPDLAQIDSFLDVGTGVGLLAVAAAGVWPDATIVGIDRWEPSLERARTHVAQASLADRVELRNQDVADLDDVDRFDCVWVPTFFLTEDQLEAMLERCVRATRPGGWVVVGRFATPPDPLAEALHRLRTIRGGGAMIDTKRAVELLQGAGCVEVGAAPRPPVVPLELVLGQKPAA